MKSLLLLFTVFTLLIPPASLAQQMYTFEGAVYDSKMNKPIEGAQVWLYGKQSGDVTDSRGRFNFTFFDLHSETRAYVRVCNEDIATSNLIKFDSESIVKTDFYLADLPDDCPSSSGYPWKVHPSEVENFKGHFILSQAGGFIETCNGHSYRPVWAEDFSPDEILPPGMQPGDRLFIHFTGRLDPYSKGVIPLQNVLVREVITAKHQAATDCE